MAGTLVKSVMLKIVSNDGDTEAKLDQITAKAQELARLHPDIAVKVDSAAASAKLAVLRKDLKDTGNAAAGDATSLRSKLMMLGSAAAVAGGFGGFSKDASLATKVMSGFSLATGLLEAPMAGAIAGVGGLASGVAAAGLGVGVFGLVAKAVYTKVSGALTQLTAAQTAYSKATTAKGQATALAAEQRAMAGLTGSQRQFAGALTTSKNAWSNFVNAASPGVTTVMAAGLRLLPQALSLMKPFLDSMEPALQVVIGSLHSALGSTWLKSFASTMGTFSGPAFIGVSTAIGNVIKGLMGILQAFVPMGVTVLGGLDKITAKFATWGQTLSGHSGFQALMTMAKTDMPYVIGIAKNLGSALVHLGGSMTGLSTFSNSKALLQLALPLSQILNDLTKANPALVRFGLYALAAGGAVGKMKPAFQGISAGVTAVKGGASAFRDLSSGFTNASAAASAATGIWGTFGGKLSSAVTAVKGWSIGAKLASAATKIWTGVQAAFDVVMAMNPIGLVVIGIAALIAVIVICVVKFKAFRTFWIGLWKDIKAFLGDAVSWIKAHWMLLPAIFMGPVGIVVALVKSHFTQIKNIAVSIINSVVGFFRALPGRIISAISALGGMLFRAGQNVMRSLISGLTSMLGAVGSAVSGIASKVAGFFGLSPAKEGPLAGGGAPEVRGAHFTHAFAAGMSSGAGRVSAAAAQMAGAAGMAGQMAGGGARGGAAPQVTLSLAPGGTGLDQLLWTYLQKQIRVHGGDPRILTQKVPSLA